MQTRDMTTHDGHMPQVHGDACLYQPSQHVPARFAAAREHLALLSVWAWREGYSRVRGERLIIPALLEADEYAALFPERRSALADWCVSAKYQIGQVVGQHDHEATRSVWQDILATLPSEVPERYVLWLKDCMTPTPSAA